MRRLYAKAILGGATISYIPSVAIGYLAEQYPALAPEELEIVSDFFASGIGPLQLVVLVIIVFVLPLVEELLFRKWLWGLLGRVLSTHWTWIATSLVFAMAHVEPLHILGLLPLSFFLGWLRKEAGDISCSATAHIANNAAACLMMII